MRYACIDDLLDDVRIALRAHPSERETLKAIAATARRGGLEAGIAAFTNWQNTINGSHKAELPQPVVDSATEAGESQPVAPQPAQTGDNAPGDASYVAAVQSASGGIAGQSTLSGEADAGAFPAARMDSGTDTASQPSFPVYASQPDSPTRTDTGQEAAGNVTTPQTGEAQAPSVAPESPVTHAKPAVDTLPTSASQNAPESATGQSTLSGKADSQPDDVARLQAQIDGCLELETNRALQLFLEQLAGDAHKYPVELVRQELDAYLQAANPNDFLNRLAALHWQWAQDDVAADPDGKRLTRGSTGERKAVLERIQPNFEWEARPILRCYLAKLARQAITDPVRAAEGLESYLDGRACPDWVWLAAVFVCGSPEAAFQWRLQEVRQRVTDCLDTLEQLARRDIPEASEKLEAFERDVIALLDGQAHSIPATVA